MLSDRLRASQDMVRRDLDPNFSWVVNETIPWTLPSKPISRSLVALVTSCGIYRVDTQLPFDAWNHLGDPSFREIHIDTPVERLRISHAHYNHDNIMADINVALPARHLLDLEEQGVIGQLYPWMYSFMGYIPEPRQFVEETIPILTARLRRDHVDAVLLTPC